MHELLFRGLLRLLPEEFRAAYARDMQATFRAELRDAGGALSAAATARLWPRRPGTSCARACSEHVDILARDARYALRTLAARPAHTITALATLALGIGANVAMFAVIDGVLLAPLPYREPERLVPIAEAERQRRGRATSATSRFLDLRARARSLDAHGRREPVHRHAAR